MFRNPQNLALALLIGLVLAACGKPTPAFAPYGLVEPEALVSTLPGPPRRLREAAAAPDEVEGYHLAGDLRAALAVARVRTSPARDDYDADVTVRVLVARTPSRAVEVFRSEAGQDERTLARIARAIVPSPAQRAAESAAWSVPGPVPRVVALARYGNYVVRIVATLAVDGPLRDEAAGLEALRRADRHMRATLDSAEARAAAFSRGGDA